MRKNLPVSQNVYDFPGDQTLISVTDLKGRITYCNSNFVSVSGYTRQELMGQPHNLVRHPDMPEEAFRDLWATIEAGQPWTGVVKNRRKNGDHYWVRANATPVRSGDRIVGYLSVRSKASPEEIAAADGLYATMRAEAESGRLVHRLRGGEVLRAGVRGWIERLRRPGLRTKLSLLCLWAGLGPLVAAWAGGSRETLLGVALLSVVSAALLSTRVVLRPLGKIVETANLIASGDLTGTVVVDGRAEIRQLQMALAQMVVTVRTVVRDVRHEVANLRGASQEIASGNHDMSVRTETQATNLEQTASSMEEINGTTQQTTQLARDGANVARETSGVARRSHEAVVSVAETMHGIAESSRRIGDIIQVIESVAFQTNILALNAAVEAARAGEQGRGFAVVAAEVRALAQRTSAASSEIRRLIEESGGRVEIGAARTSEARSRMDEAMQSVERVTAMLENISHATGEQSTGVSRVSSALVDLDGITQQNAAMVEELAAAAKSLNHQVEQVHDSIRVFRLTSRDITLAETDAVTLRKENKEEESRANLTPEQALQEHQQYIVDLRNAVMRRLTVDAKTLQRDDCCRLGQWLGENTAVWGHVPVFRDLVRQHQTMHREVGRAADAVNAGRYEDVEAMLGSGQQLQQAFRATMGAFKSLQEKVQASRESVSY